jgi:predicted Zn-dependent protease
LVLLGSAHAQAPDLGGGEDFPATTERKIGDSIAKAIYRDPDYLDDPVLVDYTQSLWQPLLKAARERGDLRGEIEDRFAWTLFLDKDPTVNAYALPGGYLGVQTGLLALSTHRAEIAAVLAHELAHITQRHLARGHAQQERQQPLLIAAMLLGAAAMTKNPEIANAAIVGSQAAAIQGQLNFSRDMEREADRVGHGVLTQAGFPAAGMASMFELLQQSSRHNDNGLFPYLRSHPLTSERIGEAQNRLSSAQGATHLPPDPFALMMAVRARLLARLDVELLRQTSDAPSGLEFSALPAPRKMAALYGACLASHKLRLHERARQQCEGLQAELSRAGEHDAELSRAVALLRAEIELREGGASASPQLQSRSQALAAWLSPSTSRSPRSVLLLWTQSRIQLGRADEARQILNSWVALHPRDALAWRQLALASQLQGNVLAEIRASAEAQAAELDFSGAVERLRAALRTPDSARADHFEQSIIQSRLRHMTEALRHQLDDERSLK